MRALLLIALMPAAAWAEPCDTACAALVRSYEYDLADYYRSHNLTPEPTAADRRSLNAHQHLCVRHCQAGGAGSECLLKSGGGSKSRACPLPPGLKTPTWAELQSLAPSFAGTTASLGRSLIDAKIYSASLRSLLESVRDMDKDPPKYSAAILSFLAGAVCPAAHAEASALDAPLQASRFMAKCKPPAQPIVRIRNELPLWQLYLAIALEREAREHGFANNPQHRRAIDALTTF
jgi:hypothetical protein